MKRIVSDGAVAGSPYSPAVRVGDLCFLAGHIGIDENQQLADGIEEQTRRTLENLRQTLLAVGLDLGDVVRTGVWVRDYKDMPVVNEIYREYFPDDHPARTAFETTALPLDALFEIEGVAVAGDR